MEPFAQLRVPKFFDPGRPLQTGQVSDPNTYGELDVGARLQGLLRKAGWQIPVAV